MKPSGPIVITGFMGCGKTEVAGALAGQLGLRMSDLDDLITQSTGRTPAQLIDQEGEPTFRQIEASILDHLLTDGTADVISLGGGAWIEGNNRQRLEKANAISIWLDTPFEICWQRIVTSTEDRPLGRTKQQAVELFERRRPIYELAQIRVEVDTTDLPVKIAGDLEAEILRLGLTKQTAK